MVLHYFAIFVRIDSWDIIRYGDVFVYWTLRKGYWNHGNLSKK
jgi:gamma-glutamylcyclotransferase (GGCT)/AIG2-like uncharacterized protein YtfP